MKNFQLLIAISILSIQYLSAQPLRNDYQRAVSFLWENLNNKKIFNLHVEPNWFEDDSGVWYQIFDKDGHTYQMTEFPSGNQVDLFDHFWLAKQIEVIIQKEVSPTDLPISDLNVASKNRIELVLDKKKYSVNPIKKSLTALADLPDLETAMESKSPDGKWIAFVKAYNLYLREVESGKEFQLSYNGKKGFEYASYYGWYDKMEGEDGMRPDRFFVRWSSDSKWIQTQICDLRFADKMYLLDWSIDTLYKPKLLSYYRGSPGDTTMVHYIPTFFNLETKKEVKPNLPRNTHINSISFKWSKDQNLVYASYAERGFKKSIIKTVNLEQNSIQSILEESAETNVENFEYWIEESLGKLFFLSERSGWRLLYSLDLETKQIALLTPGNYFINEVVEIDKNNETIYFLASGKESGVNPYHQMLYKINIDGQMIKNVTPGNVHHRVKVSPDFKYIFDNFSSATTAPITVIRSAESGEIINNVSVADVKYLIENDWKAPRLIEALGRDGITTIYGACWVPTNFDPNKKYPVIDHSYTGPHTQVFPKSFTNMLGSDCQALAELGFVVVRIDGMGSSGRSKDFHNISYKNMGQNLLGHKLALEQMAEKYSWIDLDRVGIYGHSAGGFDAGHAVLEYPNFYKVAVASSADHDFRMEKAWWPEMYMGWPVDSSYEMVSNITMAPNLKGKLLIVHGGLDDNVNPSATFKFAEALIRADKQFDMMILPSQRHGYRGQYSKYFLKMRWNYFVEHLLGTAPIWKINWDAN